MKDRNSIPDKQAQALAGQLNLKVQNLFLTRRLMCSGSVLAVLNKGLRGDLAPGMAVRLTSGFPEGMGSGCTCGSLSGAVIALG